MSTDPAQRYRVAEGTRVRLADHDPGEREGYGSKSEAQAELAELRDRISELQARLYAERGQALLIVLQALDTAGKDGAIRGVFRGVNPQGCQVFSFGAPTAEERAHDFLWRTHAKTPAKGMIGIFNRSHYEDVLVVRVQDLAPEPVWRARYASIREFESHLVREGTTVVKFYLHISKDEQKRRLQARLDDPAKHWKFNPGDLKDRARWDDFTVAYEDALSETSTEQAPWYVVPANHKWFRNIVIARTIAATLEAMDPKFPPSAEGLDDIVID